MRRLKREMMLTLRQMRARMTRTGMLKTEIKLPKTLKIILGVLLSWLLLKAMEVKCEWFLNPNSSVMLNTRERRRNSSV